MFVVNVKWNSTNKFPRCLLGLLTCVQVLQGRCTCLFYELQHSRHIKKKIWQFEEMWYRNHAPPLNWRSTDSILSIEEEHTWLPISDYKYGCYPPINEVINCKPDWAACGKDGFEFPLREVILHISPEPKLLYQSVSQLERMIASVKQKV